MKFNRRGIQVTKYEEDTLYWLWPWIERSKPRFWSSTYEIYVSSLHEYVSERKRLDIIYGVEERAKKILYLTGGGKMAGFSIKEILTSWATQLNFGIFVVLYELDLSRRPRTFWAQIPPKHRVELAKEIVVMKCRDLIVAEDIVNSLEDGFGKAFIVIDGKVKEE